MFKMKIIILIVTILSIMVIVKGEYNQYNETYYTYVCDELYKQKLLIEQNIYTDTKIRNLYKEISQMIYQMCYNEI